MIRSRSNRLPIIDDEQQQVPHCDTLPKKRTCETKPSSITALRAIRTVAGWHAHARVGMLNCMVTLHVNRATRRDLTQWL
jgi:hypothetical protein